MTKIMRTEFFLPIQPPTVTHQQKQVSAKNGKPVFFEPSELTAARTKLQAHLAAYVPKEKHTAAIRVVVKWLFPMGKHQNGEYKTTKPDLDNAAKLLLDVMTSLGFWQDDAIIASLVLEKFWAERPGIYICIEPLRRER